LDHGQISSVHSVFPNVFLASAMHVTFLIRLPHERLKKASVEETVLTNSLNIFYGTCFRWSGRRDHAIAMVQPLEKRGIHQKE
jgi:hypothetical protein